MFACKGFRDEQVMVIVEILDVSGNEFRTEGLESRYGHLVQRAVYAPEIPFGILQIEVAFVGHQIGEASDFHARSLINDGLSHRTGHIRLVLAPLVRGRSGEDIQLIDILQTLVVAEVIAYLGHYHVEGGEGHGHAQDVQQAGDLVVLQRVQKIMKYITHCE